MRAELGEVARYADLSLHSDADVFCVPQEYAACCGAVAVAAAIEESYK